MDGDVEQNQQNIRKEVQRGKEGIDHEWIPKEV